MTPVLDKGWIKRTSASLPGAEFDQFLLRINKNVVTNKSLEIPHLVLEVRCPLFVQLWLSEHFRVMPYKTSDKTEAYIPTVPEINSPNLETDVQIQASIEQTTEALLLNPQMYQMDNCDKFISQVNSPISVYNTVVAWATLAQLIEIIGMKGLPKPIEAYRKAIQDVVVAEWPNLNNYTRQIKK